MDAHHIAAKGMGGGGRLDVKENLVALDRACHTAHHYSGKPSRRELLEVVSRREGVSVEDIENTIFALRRKPKS